MIFHSIKLYTRCLVTMLSLGAPQAFAELVIQAPPTTPAGGPFEVTLEPQVLKGRVDVVQQDGSKMPQAASYTYTNPKKPMLTLIAPVKPGVYGIVFHESGKQAQGLTTFEVTPVHATLEGPQRAVIGETVSITFTGPKYAKDFIGFGDAQGQQIKGLSYAYAGNSKDGTVKLRAPMQSGSYTVLYAMATEILASQPIQVVGTEASLSAAESVQAGTIVDVAWQGPNNSGDFVTLYAPGDKRVAGHSYLANGSANLVRVQVPEALGRYDLVYVTGGIVLARKSLEVLPVSATLAAPEEVTAKFDFEVQWTGPGNSQDIIILSKVGEENSRPQHYRYLDPKTHIATLRADVAPGNYVLAYRTRMGKVLTTRPITITAALEKPGTLKVAADLSAGFGDGAGVEVILDASGSMLKKQDGKRRIDVAKDTLTALVNNTIPAGTPFTLRVFGHKESGSCRTDLEVPLAPLDPAAISATINSIEAKNLAKTPIGASLGKVAGDMANVTGERIVILLTDGEETCEGDAALAIRSLRAANTDVRVNIVGYAIDDKQLQQTFETWATLGNGAYFNAPSAAELAISMRQALEIPFRVYKDESLVLAAASGDEEYKLPPGEYTIRFKRNGEYLSKTFAVVTQKLVQVSLP